MHLSPRTIRLGNPTSCSGPTLSVMMPGRMLVMVPSNICCPTVTIFLSLLVEHGGILPPRLVRCTSQCNLQTAEVGLTWCIPSKTRVGRTAVKGEWLARRGSCFSPAHWILPPSFPRRVVMTFKCSGVLWAVVALKRTRLIACFKNWWLCALR